MLCSRHRQYDFDEAETGSPGRISCLLLVYGIIHLVGFVIFSSSIIFSWTILSIVAFCYGFGVRGPRKEMTRTFFGKRTEPRTFLEALNGQAYEKTYKMKTWRNLEPRCYALLKRYKAQEPMAQGYFS